MTMTTTDNNEQPQPHRKVNLKILRATGLMATDYNLTTDNSSDPYCIVVLGKGDDTSNKKEQQVLLQTPVIPQTMDPVWGGPQSSCEIDLMELERRCNPWITIKLYDKDVLKADDPLGKVTFHAGRVLTEILTVNGGHYPNIWRNVESLEGCPVQGRLQFRILPVTQEQQQQQDASPVQQPQVATSPPKKSPKSSSSQQLQTASPRTPPSSQHHHHHSRHTDKELLSTCKAGPKLKDTTPRSQLPQLIASSRTPVFLHIYDVSQDGRVARINAVTKVVASGGIFHGAVEVYGAEWSFGGGRKNVTGVFACPPRKCPVHHYRESIFLGDCELTIPQVKAIIEHLKPQWMAPSYNLLRKNCCSFSKEFAAELGVGNVPKWLYSLADYGAAWDDYLTERKIAKEEKKRKKLQKKLGLEEDEDDEDDDDLEEEKSEKQQQHEFIDVAQPVEYSVAEEGIEVSDLADSVIITPLDQVMAVRVQRAFRRSSAISASRRRRSSIMAEQHQEQSTMETGVEMRFAC